MNRRFSLSLCPFSLALLSAFVASFFTPQVQAQTETPAKAPRTRVENQLLVRWASQAKPLVLAPGVSPAPWQQQILQAQVSANVPGAKVKSTFAESGWSVISVPSGLADDGARAKLAKTLGGENISYNYRRQFAAAKIPNDPGYSTQWQWPQVKAPEAWGLKSGGTDVVVAVLDSGVDLNHPDIRANLWVNKKEVANGKDDDGNGYIDDLYGFNSMTPGQPPQDTFGHGTHCAGLVGAVGNNKQGLTGACWSVKIMVLKFMDQFGGGEDAQAIACMEYAVKMKKQYGVNLRVISNSWSGEPDNPALEAAFKMVEEAGILSVCAAGNGSLNGRNIDIRPEFPASYKLNSIVSVAASDRSDSLASFSNYGAKSVDLFAPGDDIISLGLNGTTRSDRGTSMATPIVAGAAALLAMRDPSLTAAQIKERLLTTVDKFPRLQGKVVSGGRLNMQRTLSNALLSISGMVYRLNGTTKVPLTGALIKVNNKTTTSTDKNGKYVLTDLAPGTYPLTATLKGFTFKAASVAMPRPAGTTGAPNGIVDFPALTEAATRYSISGYARDASGKGVKGLSIFIVGVPNPITVTDSNGRYKIVDRGAGSYKLAASGGEFTWVPDLISVAVPARNGTFGAPDGVVNFSAIAPDKAAPAITITNPTGAQILPGAPLASGTATDGTGTAQLYFQLSRRLNGEISYYNWTQQAWTSDSGETGNKLTQNVNGTAVNWKQQLPTLIPATYTLLVWGRDSLGNESQGEADEVVTFIVASSAQTARKAVPTPVPPPSGAAS